MTEKKRGILIVDSGRSENKQKADGKPLQRPVPQRKEWQLVPLAERISLDEVLMDKFRSAAGSENKPLVREVTNTIIQRAQELDDTISIAEAVTIVWILGRMIGHFPE